MSKFKTKKFAGFTAIELAMVIVVIGILGVAAISRFANTATFSSRVFFDDILSSIHYAQKYAVGTGCHIQVSATATTLTLTQRSACSTGTFSPGVGVVDPVNRGAATYVRTAPANSGLTISSISGDWPIYFDALGVAHRTNGTIGFNPNPYTLTVGGQVISVVGITGLTQ